MKSFVTHTTTQYATTYYVRDPQGNVLAVYERKRGETGQGTLTLTEQHLYGAGRIGMRKRNLALGGGAEEPVAPSTHYALTNHLGNVLAVISDAPGGGTQPTVESLTDYYPFGMAMPGRSYNATDYRFGYTGHEKEGDLAEGVYTTQYRLLDTRLGRWMSVDPLFGKYPDMGAYNYCAGNPVGCWDPDGRRTKYTSGANPTINSKSVSETAKSLSQKYKSFRIIYNFVENSKCTYWISQKEGGTWRHRGRVLSAKTNDNFVIEFFYKKDGPTNTTIWSESWNKHTLFEEFFHGVQRAYSPTTSTIQREVEAKYTRLVFGWYEKEGGTPEDELFRKLKAKFGDRIKDDATKVCEEMAEILIQPGDNPKNLGFGYQHLSNQYDSKTFKPTFEVYNMLVKEYNKKENEKK